MFPCNSCGLCCQYISNIKELKEFDLGNGVCKYFDIKYNICKIYETRPDICRVDKMFKIKYKNYFTKEKFYQMNIEACSALQKQFNIDNNFKIKFEG